MIYLEPKWGPLNFCFFHFGLGSGQKGVDLLEVMVAIFRDASFTEETWPVDWSFVTFNHWGSCYFFDWIVYNLAGSKGTRLHMGQHLFKPTFTWVCRKKKLDDYWWILEGKLWNLRTPGISMTSFPYVVLIFWDSHRTLVNIEHVQPTVLLQQSVPWSSWALNLEGQQNTCVYI